MFTVVAYDVVDDRRRNRVMKLLKGHGRHVQKSVFECHLEMRQIQELASRLGALIDEQKDTVRIYVVPRRSVKQIIALGVGEITRAEKVVVV